VLVPVVPDLVTGRDDRLHRRWVPLGGCPRHEEGRPHAALGEDLEQPRDAGHRSVPLV